MVEPIILQDPDPAWVQRFHVLARGLRSSLGDLAQRIDHTGSTAVPGLAAKPIVDIQVSIASFGDFDPARNALQELGYVWRSGNPDISKRYFREGPGEPRTHIHVREAGSWFEQCNLLFRDYLREHDEAVREYARVKAELAQRFRNDRRAYTEGKGPIFWELLQRASAWAQETGWRAGPSDG